MPISFFLNLIRIASIILIIFILFGQILGIAYVLSGGKFYIPKRLRITAGILQILLIVIIVYRALNPDFCA